MVKSYLKPLLHRMNEYVFDNGLCIFYREELIIDHFGPIHSAASQTFFPYTRAIAVKM